LLGVAKSGKLPSGTIKSAAEKFIVSTKTISRIWRRSKETPENSPANVVSKKAGHVGRKRIHLDLGEKLKAVPLRRRKNLRSIAFELNISKSTLHRRLKEGEFRAHSSALKPFLKEENHRSRIEFVLSRIDLFLSPPAFDCMFQEVHVDEKWFNLTEINGRFYLANDEEDPHRTAQSKRFITKVMFICAVARPRFDRYKNQWFDGKIGIWPIVKKEMAKRSSKNRPKGTLVTVPVNVDKTVYRDLMVSKIIPAVQEKWPGSPAERCREIWIQHDNAKPHISPTDPDFIAAAALNGFHIRLRFQPPNSPDMNILDLGFFRAIQSLQYQKDARSIDELIRNVEDAFEEMKHESLNKVFLSLQANMIETLKVGGSNKYKLAHMAKDRLTRAGDLPVTLTVTDDVISMGLQALNA
jgi:transposase